MEKFSKHFYYMSIVEQLQKKAAGLPESTAAEVLDFLEFLSAKTNQQESVTRSTKFQSVRGAFRGRLSTSQQFSEAKQHEIGLER